MYHPHSSYNPSTAAATPQNDLTESRPRRCQRREDGGRAWFLIPTTGMKWLRHFTGVGRRWLYTTRLNNRQ